MAPSLLVKRPSFPSVVAFSLGLFVALPLAAAEEAPAAPAAPAPSSTGAVQEATEKPENVRARREASEADRRAREVATSGKKALAERLGSLAERWRQVTQALEVVFALEAEATALEKRLIELEEQTARARLLVEQTEARRARALHRLEELHLTTSGVPRAVSPPTPAGSTPAATTPPTTSPTPTPPPTKGSAPVSPEGASE